MTTRRITSWQLTAAIVLCFVAGLICAPALAVEKEGGSEGTEDPSLEEKVEILTEEVSRLREQMNIPETDKELTGAYGMGPAASKVYGVSQGISFGGYGEFYFASPYGDTEVTGQVNITDFYRFIAYFGYKFNSWIVMNTEIEYEHATTSSNFQGKSGSVSVEFAYLDFLINQGINVRAGNLLIPMGFLNLIHEPTTYWGNFRPFVETTIIPSTWREMGIGLHGNMHDIRYSVYLLNGFNGSKFDNKGVRSGRQKANRAVWEDVGGVLALDYSYSGITNGVVQVGGSVFAGGADQNMIEDENGDKLSVNNEIYELHAEFRKGRFKTRVLAAASHISNAGALSEILFADDGNGELSKQVPERQFGWYAEAGYDVAPLIWRQANFTLTPWLRYEQYNLQDQVSADTALPADPSLEGTFLTVGLESKPHPNVVIKFDLVFPTNESSDPVSDEIRLGAGFIF
ncbi:MAG: hypothetical protein JSW50_16825 [Candidatus Latescibacterota bacterium]|nr:MAG: hypothetical protein JSW50_16825 [Candidatus Latescibacterota bacterium]